MSKASFARPTSILASLFLAAIIGGCGAAVESGEGEDGFEDEVGQTDDGDIGESEEALKFTNPTGGTSDPTNGCGWFCPWWAKDLSDCIIKICNNNGTSGGVYAP